jgi:hypothetical protein
MSYVKLDSDEAPINALCRDKTRNRERDNGPGHSAGNVGGDGF